MGENANNLKVEAKLFLKNTLMKKNVRTHDVDFGPHLDEDRPLLDITGASCSKIIDAIFFG